MVTGDNLNAKAIAPALAVYWYITAGEEPETTDSSDRREARQVVGLSNKLEIRRILSPTTASALTIISAVTFVTNRHTTSQCPDSNSGS